MKKGKACNKALKHILCCLIILLIFVITFTLKVEAKTETVINADTEDVVPLKPQLRNELLELKKIKIVNLEAITYDQPRIIEKDIYSYLEEENEELLFFSKIFGFNYEFVKDNIITRSEQYDYIEPTNIGFLKDKEGNLKKYRNIEYGIVEYFYELSDLYPKIRNKKHVSYNGTSDYIENLILYYTSIYDNVDSTLALSIGAAESGYYKVKYMLHKNNIYGGMSSNGLISHENIEIGVLKYIRMLSRSYFGKGLTNEYLIGKKYCPTRDDNGNKIASPHWINLVNTAKNKYKNYTQNVSINEIVNY